MKLNLCRTDNRIMTVLYLFIFVIKLTWVWGIAATVGQNSAGMPQVEAIDVKCGRAGLSVALSMDRGFCGVVFSKGHFAEPACNYVRSTGEARTEFRFRIPAGRCGTETLGSESANATLVNTIVIQNDPLFQEIWDSAVRLSCSVASMFSKSVKTNPISVVAPEVVNVKLETGAEASRGLDQNRAAGRSSDVLGFVVADPDPVMVVLFKDGGGRGRDANVVSCFMETRTGRRQELVDRNGCVLNTSFMSPFAKSFEPPNYDADIVFTSNIKNTNIDSSALKISCRMEICDGSCLEPCILGPFEDLN